MTIEQNLQISNTGMNNKCSGYGGSMGSSGSDNKALF